MAKILIISPVPTHPPTAGHRARVLDICLLLKEKGYELDFLYLYRNKGEGIETTKAFFGENNYHCYKVKKRKYKTALHPLFFALAKKKIIQPTNIFNYSVDYWFERGMISVIQQLVKENDYKAIIAEYVFYSKFFNYIPASIKKIIDTHDKFTDRWKVLYDADIVPHWFSASAQEERKGLNRADMVLAIQEKEATFFRSICNKPVISLGNRIFTKAKPNLHVMPNLLFIASDNAVNIQAIDFFLKESLPNLVQQIPNIKLYVAGSICRYLQGQDTLHSTVELMGFVDKIGDFYTKGSIVINPILSGTGLKIKNIEALSYGKYLVTTPCGAEGMEKGIEKTFLVAKTSIEFVQHICAIIKQVKIRETLQKGIPLFIQAWNMEYDRNATQLIKLIESA